MSWLCTKEAGDKRPAEASELAFVPADQLGSAPASSTPVEAVWMPVSSASGWLTARQDD